MNGRQRLRRAAAAMTILCLTAAMLSGCSSRGNEEKQPAPTFAPASAGRPAPDGDQTVRQEKTYTVYAYLPEKSTLQLTPQTVTLAEFNVQATAEKLIQELLAAMNRGRAENERLELFNDKGSIRAPEISGGICTVSLGPSAQKLEYRERYLLSIALATTLCELDEISGVNVLIADKSVLDDPGTLVMGTLNGHPEDFLPELWEQKQNRKAFPRTEGSENYLNIAATIYYPLSDERGIGCESQMLTFGWQNPDQLAKELIRAITRAMKRRLGNENLPELENYIQETTPAVSERDDGDRNVNIIFRENIRELLDRWDTDLPCLIAAVSATVFTFVPGVYDVSVSIGSEAVTDREMSNRYHHDYQRDDILSGTLHRNIAASFLTGSMTVFFEKDGKLTACEKPVDRELADSPREMLEALLEGPDRREKANGISATLPSGLNSRDVLVGIAADGDTLLVNLSVDFRKEIEKFGAGKETLLCYSMVNTLCANTGKKRVCFFFGNEQAETIAGEIYWGGEFIFNPGL